MVIDTAPRELAGAAAAARLSDRVLIPCRPSAVDLATIPPTLAVIGGHAGAAVVLNACPPRGSWTAEAVEAVRAMGAALCPQPLGARVVHARAFTSGRTAQETEPRSPAARRDRTPLPLDHGDANMTTTRKPTLADAVQASADPATTAVSGVTPSRRGKRAWTIYLDRDTARQLKALAALNDRSLQSFGEEAADLLIERYRS